MRQDNQVLLWEALHSIMGNSISEWDLSQRSLLKILWADYTLTSIPKYQESNIVRILVPTEAILTVDILVIISASNITDINIGMDIIGIITNTRHRYITDTTIGMDMISPITITNHRDIITSINLTGTILCPGSFIIGITAD
jgi:hypothetical protein